MLLHRKQLVYDPAMIFLKPVQKLHVGAVAGRRHIADLYQCVGASENGRGNDYGPVPIHGTCYDIGRFEHIDGICKRTAPEFEYLHIYC